MPKLSPGELLFEQINDEDLARSQRHGRNSRRYNSRFFWELEAQREQSKEAINAALQSVPGITVNVDGWCRAMKARYFLSPLSCIGSMRVSGRFNFGADVDENNRFPAFPALYIAENRATAHCEMVGYTEPDGVHRGEVLSGEALALMRDTSITLAAISGHVSNVFDLTDDKNLKSFIEETRDFKFTSDFRKFERELGFKPIQIARSSKELLGTFMDPSWRTFPMYLDLPANSQVFGKLLMAAGFEGVLYRSMRTDGRALAIYPRCFAASSSVVKIVDPLPSAVCTELNSATHMDCERDPPDN